MKFWIRNRLFQKSIFIYTFREKQTLREISVCYFLSPLRADLWSSTYFSLGAEIVVHLKIKKLTTLRNKVAIYKLSIMRQYSPTVIE